MADEFDIPTFRHSINDEPNEDWTVEEVFQWTLLRSYQLLDEKCTHMADGLRQELQQGAQELVVAEEPSLTTTGKETTTATASAASTQPHRNAENAPPNQAPIQTRATAATTAATTTSTSAAATHHHHNNHTTVTLHVQVLNSDVYDAGRTFTLKLTKKTVCWVGRSSSKKFRHNGLSLAKDLEVSTTHGKFTLDGNNKVYYTDTGSTNGSKLDQVTLEADVPYEILAASGAPTLLVGATQLQLTIG